MTDTPPAASPPSPPHSRTDRLLASLAGILAGYGGLAAAGLVAVVVRPEAGPVPAVGDAVVDLTPTGVKEWAIRTFGESDKAVLEFGILVLLAALAAGLGRLALRSTAAALAGVALVGAVGALAAVSRPDSESASDALPSLVGAATAAALLYVLVRRLTRPRPAAARAAGRRPRWRRRRG